MRHEISTTTIRLENNDDVINNVLGTVNCVALRQFLQFVDQLSESDFDVQRRLERTHVRTVEEIIEQMVTKGAKGSSENMPQECERKEMGLARGNQGRY